MKTKPVKPNSQSSKNKFNRKQLNQQKRSKSFKLIG